MYYCTYCGKEINDDSVFCPYCGKPLTEEVTGEVNGTTSPAVSRILTLGIVAAAVSSFGIPGIVVGAIGKGKVREYLATDGRKSTQVKIGSILSKVGFGVGIGMTAVWALYIAMLAVIIATGAMH